VDWVEADAAQTLRAGLARRLERWRQTGKAATATSTCSTTRSFAPPTLLAEWFGAEARNAREWIKVQLSDVMFPYPGRNDVAVISFLQDYSSSNLSNKMRKRQYWIRKATPGRFCTRAPLENGWSSGPVQGRACALGDMPSGKSPGTGRVLAPDGKIGGNHGQAAHQPRHDHPELTPRRRQ
jgi:hypothetical protein